jgi:hypothetical protein
MKAVKACRRHEKPLGILFTSASPLPLDTPRSLHVDSVLHPSTSSHISRCALRPCFRKSAALRDEDKPPVVPCPALPSCATRCSSVGCGEVR